MDKLDCTFVHDHLNAYLDKTLDKARLEDFESHLSECGTCRETVETQRFVIESIQSLPVHACPDSVTHAIRNAVKPKRSFSWTSVIDRVLPSPVWQWATAGAAAIAIVLSIFLRNEPAPQTQPTKTYTQEEIERAKAEAIYSLLYASKKLKQAEKNAIGDAVIKQLPETLRNTVKNTMPIIKGGES